MTITISANRRALAAVCHSQSSRLVHSSSISHATALSPGSLAGQKVEEITIQPIFDIFDAPSSLAESGEFIRDKYRSSTKAPDAFSSPHTRPVPTPLPPPVLFDGPARPKNAAIAFQSRLRQAGLAPASPARRDRTSSRPFSSSEILVQMFEGPARITRYHHQPSGEKEQKTTKYIVALGVAGAVGCAALAKDNERPQSP